MTNFQKKCLFIGQIKHACLEINSSVTAAARGASEAALRLCRETPCGEWLYFGVKGKLSGLQAAQKVFIDQPTRSEGMLANYFVFLNQKVGSSLNLGGVLIDPWHRL